VLLAAAETHDADLIAIAGQGLRGVQRMLVGSVADKLIRSATVPVLVVPVHPS
jgi:nucleotide-binding universal stress UspA family protein